MLLGATLVIAGLLLLYYGAEYLVTGSSRLALSFGVRPLVVGLTVVAFATSMPELMVSLLAATRGASSMAVGNIIGSNIANIGLILGVAALITPIVVARSTLVREVPIMVAASLGVYLVALDGEIAFTNGLELFLCLLVFLAYCLVTARKPLVPADGEIESNCQSVHRARTKYCTGSGWHGRSGVRCRIDGAGGGYDCHSARNVRVNYRSVNCCCRHQPAGVGCVGDECLEGGDGYQCR